MKLGAKGEAIIKAKEALRLSAYPDEAGIPTIGWGCIRRRDGSPVSLADPPITEGDAQWLFDRDVATEVSAVNRLIVSPLNQNQFDALVCFTYNVGAGALQVSALRNCINHGNPVGQELFTRWDMTGRPLRESAGLLKRRIQEHALYCERV
jgi:lysozyme